MRAAAENCGCLVRWCGNRVSQRVDRFCACLDRRGGFGAFVIILLLGIPCCSQYYTSAPSYLDLLIKRQRTIRDRENTLTS